MLPGAHALAVEVLTIGTKVRRIRLRDVIVDGHDTGAKVPGFGAMQLRSSVVRKVD